MVSRRGRTLCGRALPLFALPVVGTGEAGAKEETGAVLRTLVQRLNRFCASHAADVVLVTRSRQMLSAAQSTRRTLETAG